MSRTTKNSAHVINTSVASVNQESSSSEQETNMQDPSLQPSTSQTQFVSSVFMPYIEGPYRRSQDGLDSEWWLVSQVHEVVAEVWKYFRLWTCNAFWVKEMQESHSLEWWFWDGSVFPGVCPLKTLVWIQFGLSMKIFTSLKWMRSEQDLTCLQASARVIDLLISGTVEYKHKCLLLNTHKTQQTSCIMTSFGFLEGWEIYVKSHQWQ